MRISTDGSGPKTSSIEQLGNKVHHNKPFVIYGNISTDSEQRVGLFRDCHAIRQKCNGRKDKVVQKLQVCINKLVNYEVPCNIMCDFQKELSFKLCLKTPRMFLKGHYVVLERISYTYNINEVIE